LFLIAVLVSQVQASVPEPKGIWEFNAPDTSGATTGAPLELVGTVKPAAGITATDGAILIGEGSYYICTHGIAPNGGGAKVNEWTLLIDFSFPPSSLSDPPSGYNDLFQTNPTNADDSDWTINSSGAVGIGAVGYSSTKAFTTKGNTWYRMVLVVDNGTRHDIYFDGVEIFKGNQQGVDGRFSLASTILLFCAGNNQDRDDAPINVSTVAFWDKPLTAEDVAAIGRAGDGFFVRKGASSPAPANGADDVLVTADLAWTAGAYAATHDVFFAPSQEAVAAADPAALIAEGLALDITTLDVGVLDFGQTYFWRVDEVNDAPDNTVVKGQVWSFTTEPYAYPIAAVTATASSAQAGMDAQNTVNGSGLNGLDEHSTDAKQMWTTTEVKPHWIQFEFDAVYKLHEMWVWNSNQVIESFVGFGARDVTVEYSTDGQTWLTLAGVPEFAKASGLPTYTANTTVAFQGVQAQYVRLSIHSNWGVAPQVGLSEVRFLYVPVKAFEPQPAIDATGVSVEATLGWRAGRDVTSHKVYLGTDEAAVAAGSAAAQTVTEPAFAPADLKFATDYFWKVDEVGQAGVYPGDVWSFTTQEFAPIDDMEGYTDDEGNRIYESWVDGLTNGQSGSTVGYLKAPFAERTVVRGGSQSMPLAYNNATTPYYSEAELAFDSPRNLTAHGAGAVSLYFQGVTPAFKELASGHILMNGLGADIWGTADQFRFAHKTLTGNGTMIARVNSVYNSNVWAKAGVMIRQSASAGSVHAFACITPGGAGAGNGASFQRRPVVDAASTNSNSATVVAAPYWVKIERVGDNFSAYMSPDGVAWTSLGAAVSIPMTGPVLIGLALCSHNATALTGADFSDVATTGNVTGAWQIAEIGLAQREGNSPEGLYLTVKDSAGRSKTIVNPDAAATARMGWQQWLIPLADLTAGGLKATAVDSIVIGVGSRTSPATGGAGTIYIDDIGFGVPMP
jgi:hypothetical protein